MEAIKLIDLHINNNLERKVKGKYLKEFNSLAFIKQDLLNMINKEREYKLRIEYLELEKKNIQDKFETALEIMEEIKK